MRAVEVTAPGEPEVLTWGHAFAPECGPDEVLIRVAAAGVNRADVQQRRGHYPPPPGSSPILGLEVSGEIVAVGDDVAGPAVGDRVCALLSGGGYAELVAVPAVQVLPVPDGISVVEAAGLMETVCTVWSNLVMTAGLSAGQTVLIHGGAGGIGTTAIQIGRALGARVAVTAGSADKLRACRELGADIGIDYRTGDFVEELAGATDGQGADVILDVIGAKYLARNVQALATGGRLVIIGLQGGARAELDIGALLTGRKSVHGTTLRGRPVTGPGSKAEVVAAVRDQVWPMVADGRVRPIIGGTFPMSRAADAHALMESADAPGGKLLLLPD